MASYTDDFNRASLGANWTQDSGTWSIDSSIRLWQTNAATSYYKLRWAGGAMDSTNYYSEVQGVSSTSSRGFGAFVRGAASSTVTYYTLVGFGGDSFYLVEVTAGVETILASGGTCTANVTYTLRLTADGSNLTGNYGAGSLNTTDGTLTSGDIGCMAFDNLDTAVNWIDNWAGADLAAPTGAPRFMTLMRGFW